MTETNKITESNAAPDFVAIATSLIERGFRVTPVHPETKMGVMKNWQKFQLTSSEQLKQHAKYFWNHNVGVVSKRGIGRHCFLDDDSGVVKRIEHETGRSMPLTYTVQSRPEPVGIEKSQCKRCYSVGTESKGKFNSSHAV